MQEVTDHLAVSQFPSHPVVTSCPIQQEGFKLTNSAAVERQCPDWCVRDDTADPERTLHLSEVTEHPLAREDRATAVSIESTVSADGAAGAVVLEQAAGTDGIRLTGSEAVKLGADLVRHGEWLMYGDLDGLPDRKHVPAEAWQKVISRLAEVFVRLDMDELRNALDDAAESEAKATLSHTVLELGLNWEYGIGRRLSRILDIVERGCLAIGALAALRMVANHPDLHTLELGGLLRVAQSVELDEAIDALEDAAQCA